jgi:hypothetical protein
MGWGGSIIFHEVEDELFVFFIFNAEAGGTMERTGIYRIACARESKEHWEAGIFILTSPPPSP